MTSPRYQILNLLAPAAYPRQDIQTVPPHTPRDQPAALTYHIPTTSPHRHYHQNLRLALRLYLSICRAVLTLFVRITPDIRTETHNSPAGRARERVYAQPFRIPKELGEKLFSDDAEKVQTTRKKEREKEDQVSVSVIDMY